VDVRRRPAPTTVTAGVVALGVALSVTGFGLSALRTALDPVLDDATLSVLVESGAPGEARTLGIVGWISAVVTLGVAVLEVALGLGVLARRPWAREGGLVIFGLLGLLLTVVSLQGLSSTPRGENAPVGLALGLAHLAVVVLLALRRTGDDITDADATRRRTAFARAEQRRSRRAQSG
jgi:hypothetical protein